jgi:hypothetical protein
MTSHSPYRSSTLKKASSMSISMSPAEEFHHVLDRIEHRISISRESYRDKLREAYHKSTTTDTNVKESPIRKGFGRFLIRGRSSDTGNDKSLATTSTGTPPRATQGNVDVTTASTSASPSPSPLRKEHHQQSTTTPTSGPIADFIPMTTTHIDEFVEDLRRIAELCVIGENFVTKIQKKHDMADLRAQRKWAAARDALLEDVSESEPAYDETSSDYIEKLQLFDLFFERNALTTIVDMLHGESFSFEKHPRKSDETSNDNIPEHGDANNKQQLNESISSIPESDLFADVGRLLPPLAVATQALQSVSILIQNVSRATSLYAILSNNCINKLFDLPLDLYTAAEKRRLIATKESKSLPAIFSSPQITELSTHFVTFLKSLALRMNAETLQFFIKYNGPSRIETDPSETTDSDELNILQNVEFPLYVRALEFCAAHHDSFVRTTALNICLNTLRLTTISDSGNESIELQHQDEPQQSSPDTALHNAKPLPYNERLIIAQYACIPSRVEHLISPIFTKLAERWSLIDEQMRMIDNNKYMGFTESNDDTGIRNERVAIAKEKVRRDRMIRNFKETIADLQDELLLLDDVFQVGYLK